MTNFVNLHTQTTYSLLDSLIEPKALFKRVPELGQSAIAITEHGSLASAWECWKLSKETGIKLIIGCECYFQDDDTDKFRHIILLAKNAIGYRNLLTLNKKGFDHNSFLGKRVYSVINWELLEQHAEGLICLTACGNGIISQLLMNQKMIEAEQTILRLKKIFGDHLGLEVQPNNMRRGSNIFNNEIDQNFLNRQLIQLGKKHDVKVVATCNAHYLIKEDADTHNVLLAIGARQPVYSNFRLRYPVPEFYLKTGDEVKEFFVRSFPDQAQQLCDNSLYFADLCEVPEWIDPKYSNPTGKELPIFPVKDEPDYTEFKSWSSQQSTEVQQLDEDKQFLRYKCKTLFDTRIKSLSDEQRLTYQARIEEELDVLEFHGFSSYMLIVADFLNWAKKHDILVGTGRGCLTGETKVMSSNGFKRLDEIKIGDLVYTHTGKLQRVLNTFRFNPPNEKMLNIKMENSFGSLTLTTDHEIFACKRKNDNILVHRFYNGKKHRYYNHPLIMESPKWLEAKSLKPGDLVYTKFPITNNDEYYQRFDLGKYATYEKVLENNIEIKLSKIKDLSIRKIQKAINLSFEVVRKAKNNNLNDLQKLSVIEKYVLNHGMTLQEWRDMPKYDFKYVNRYLELSDDCLYMLGRWVGDGSIRYQCKNGINFSFNIEEQYSINIIKSFYEKMGFNVYGRKSNEKGFSLDIGTSLLSCLFIDIFPDYKCSSSTKHLPIFFRSLSKRQLKCLINGVIDSDGHDRKDGESIKTTSFRLINELKEALNILGIVSAVTTEKANNNHGRNNATSYLIRFEGIQRPNRTIAIYDNGYYSKISKISQVKSDYIYDITVDQDHSYLTSSGVVHNSVGGSLVAYLLDIHQADPIKYNLIFARFHNKEKASFPDIDNDIAPSGRELVQNYLRQKYGADYVAHVSNINTITPKVYARDIARSCELGGSREEATKLGNDVADCLSAELHSITEALSKVPLFGEYAKRYPEFEKYKSICGKYRANSTHAGGILISARPLVGLVPLRKDKDGSLALEYDKDKAEENGLVKIDILGLSTLDIIGRTIKLIKQAGKEPPTEPFDYGMEDSKTYDLISAGDTFCVFQLGVSGGTIDLCRRIKPKNINDIANINALARPSARDMRNDFVKTRNGEKPVSLLHPKLQRAFGDTYGFGLYEECLMYLAQDIAGWSLHSADRLRKLTKEKGKNPKKVQGWRTEFVNDASKHGVKEIIATRIWDEVVSNFQGYGFNKSHAVLYSMISFKTAYLKAHFPIEFLMANLMAEVNSATPDARANIDKIKKELKKHHVKIIKPDVNKSDLVYTIEDGNKLITGLSAIKFVGDDAIKDIVEKRPFYSFFDFMTRVSSKTVRANNIQALVACGALDSFKLSRKSMFLYCSDYRKKLKIWCKKHDPNVDEFIFPFPETPEWSKSELYALEHFYLGEAFVCKPAEAYGAFFEDAHETVKDVKRAGERQRINSIKGIVRSFFEFRVKKEGSKYYGQPMMKAIIEDKFGEQCSMTIFPDRLNQMKDRIKEINKHVEFEPGIALYFSGTANTYEDNIGIIMDRVFNMAIVPSMPLDLKAKKLNLKEAKKKHKEEVQTPEEILDGIEEELYDRGLVDLDAEDNDDENS